MIKGCSKRMIMLKDTGSDFFEEAYFILKTSSPFCALRSERDFIAEANRIVAESRGDILPAFPPAKKQKGRGGVFVCGALCGILFSVLIFTISKALS